MKKSCLIAAAAIMFVFVVTPKQAAAQKYQGQVVIGANGAFSVLGLVMNSLLNTAGNNITGVSYHSAPGISGTVDYGVTDRFSLGIAHFYQSFNIKWNGYTDSSGFNQTGDFHYRATRQNTAIRALFHFGDNDDLDPYFGIRLGYSYWSHSTNVTNVGSNFFSVDKLASHFWPQAIFGIRYFFTQNIGVNAELALGFPYYLSAGINVRFGGQ
jgi:opacity protein-like surface antigen